MAREKFNNFNGFINIYKEADWTSMDVCAKLRGILGMRKIGHAGTLDPMAEGVLPVALGKATKDVERIGDGTKTYKAGMLLGCVTDTQDTTGTVLRQFEGTLPDAEAITAAAKSFIGSYDQLTPMYSARKVQGKKLYEYARAGKEVERKRKTVEILALSVDRIEGAHVSMTVTCTKGTYIRTLCHDIGEKLSCGACMESLLRTQVGDFTIESAIKLSEAEALRKENRIDEALTIKAETAVALGNFDGTHIGHQALFRKLLREAQEKRLKTCVLILDTDKPHISGYQERREALYRLGIDYVMELRLNEALKGMEAERFVEEILLRKLNMKLIAAGPDVSFGYQRKGDRALLTALSERYGYEVRIIDKVTYRETDIENQNEKTDEAGMKGAADKAHGDAASAQNPVQIVSSTCIREALKRGQMEKAAMLLGTPYSVTGTVVHGRGLGNSVLGFATMNVEIEEGRLIPPYGVYAVRLWFLNEKEEEAYEGIANLGIRPTVAEEGKDGNGGNAVNLETHLFSYEGDAYGKEIRVELLHFIRKERKFESLKALREQLLKTDMEAARAFFIESPCQKKYDMVR